MSLQVWLPLNGDLRNQGLSNITVTNNGATVDNNGKIGKCYSFDGNSLYGDWSEINTLTQISGCCWVYLNNLSSAQYFFHLGGQSSYPCKFSLDYEGSIRFQINGTEYISGITLTTGIWYHLAITWNGTMAKLYVDGIESYSKSATGSFSASNHFAIGARTKGTAGNTFAYAITNGGKLNDIRLYDHCLSPRQIKEISKGLVLHYPLNRGGFGSPNLIINSKNIKGSHLESGNEYMALNVGQSYMDIESGTQVTISFDLEMKYVNTGTSSAKYLHIYNTNNKGPKQISDVNWYPEQHGYSVGDIIKTRASVTTTIVDRADHKTDDNYIEFYTVYNTGNVFSISNLKVEYGDKATPWCPNEADDLYSQMGLDNNIVYDCSGYCNNGETMTDTITYSSDTPRYNISTHFNGTYDGIIIENLQLSNIINTEITYSFWVKPENEKGGRSVYFGSYSGSSWSIEKTSGGVLRLYWNGSPDETFNNCIITDDVWQHICITKSGTNDVKIYKNGVQVATSTKTHSELNFPTTYRIGRDVRSNDGTPYKGLMSDFRVYATALSSEDVYNLYAVGASLSDTGVLFSNEVSEV